MTLYLSAVWTQSGESGNTLKIKCSDTADERANIFSVPTTSEAECISQCSVSDTMPYSYQASLPQRRQSGAAAHDFGSLNRKKKSPGGISEAMRYGIVSPLGLRPEAQRQCRQSPTAVPERP